MPLSFSILGNYASVTALGLILLAKALHYAWRKFSKQSA
jgi:hypothetical protein